MGKNWLSYFWCGGIALFISWALTGCYWGNKEVDAPFNGPWYYETQLGSVQLCAQVAGQASPQCATGLNQQLLPSFQIPLASGLTLDLSTLSDPILLSELSSSDASTVGATFGVYNSDNGSLSFFVNNNDNAVSYSASTSLGFYQDTQGNAICALNVDVSINGNLTSTGPFTSGYTANPITGRAVFTETVSMTQSGTGCAEAEACYNDASQCTNNAQSTVDSVYENFTSTNGGAGVLNMEPNPTGSPDVGPSITSLQYVMTYQ